MGMNGWGWREVAVVPVRRSQPLRPKGPALPLEVVLGHPGSQENPLPCVARVRTLQTLLGSQTRR